MENDQMSFVLLFKKRSRSCSAVVDVAAAAAAAPRHFVYVHRPPSCSEQLIARPNALNEPAESRRVALPLSDACGAYCVASAQCGSGARDEVLGPDAPMCVEREASGHATITGLIGGGCRDAAPCLCYRENF